MCTHVLQTVAKCIRLHRPRRQLSWSLSRARSLYCFSLSLSLSLWFASHLLLPSPSQPSSHRDCSLSHPFPPHTLSSQVSTTVQNVSLIPQRERDSLPPPPPAPSSFQRCDTGVRVQSSRSIARRGRPSGRALSSRLVGDDGVSGLREDLHSGHGAEAAGRVPARHRHPVWLEVHVFHQGRQSAVPRRPSRRGREAADLVHGWQHSGGAAQTCPQRLLDGWARAGSLERGQTASHQSAHLLAPNTVAAADAAEAARRVHRPGPVQCV